MRFSRTAKRQQSDAVSPMDERRTAREGASLNKDSQQLGPVRTNREFRRYSEKKCESLATTATTGLRGSADPGTEGKKSVYAEDHELKLSRQMASRQLGPGRNIERVTPPPTICNLTGCPCTEHSRARAHRCAPFTPISAEVRQGPPVRSRSHPPIFSTTCARFLSFRPQRCRQKFGRSELHDQTGGRSPGSILRDCSLA